MQTDFKLYKVDMKYIRNLHNIDDKVLSVSPQAGKDNRVFIGLVDTTIFKRDRENIRYYKKLCTLELEWCQTNNEVICNKANVLYKKYLSNDPFAGRNRCLNFPKLEAECEKYNLKTKKGTN